MMKDLHRSCYWWQNQMWVMWVAWKREMRIATGLQLKIPPLFIPISNAMSPPDMVVLLVKNSQIVPQYTTLACWWWFWWWWWQDRIDSDALLLPECLDWVNQEFLNRQDFSLSFLQTVVCRLHPVVYSVNHNTPCHFKSSWKVPDW